MRKHTITLTLMAVLTACGGGSGGGNNSNGNGNSPGVSLQGASVTGTSAATGGVTPINPGVNNGDFSVTLQIGGDEDLYRMAVYISDNATFEPVNDIALAKKNCGVVVTTCQATETFRCQFTTDNKVICLDPNTQTANLSGFLDQLPKQAQLIAELCGGVLTTTCEYRALPVVLQ